MAVIINMVGLDSSTSINCQVRMVPPIPPTIELTENVLESYGLSLKWCATPFRLKRRTTTEDLSTDIRLFGLRWRVSAGRTSHVRPDSIFFFADLLTRERLYMMVAT